jgi:hypothetical protein
MGSRLRTAETLEEAAVCIVPPRHRWRIATHFAGTCAGFLQQTQIRAKPQPVGTHRQQLYATGIPIPTRPTPPHPHPARRQPHPGRRQPNPATRAPRHPHAPPRHPAPRHPHPPTRPTLPKATWPPPHPRPPQRADASVLESATAPLIAAIAATTRINLRNIGVSPLHACVAAPNVPRFPNKSGAQLLRTARNLWIDISESIPTTSTNRAPASNGPTIEPAWREDAGIRPR